MDSLSFRVLISSKIMMLKEALANMKMSGPAILQ